MYKTNRAIRGILAAAGLLTVVATAQSAQAPPKPQSKAEIRKMLERTITRRPDDIPKPARPAARAAASKPVPHAADKSAAADGLNIDGNVIQYNDVDLKDFIKSMAALVKKNFDIDDSVKGRVTLITNEPISREMAYPLLESILQARGYTLVPTLDGELIRVIQARRAVSSDIPVGVGNERTKIEGYERFQTQLVPIVYGDAAEISQVLTSLINQEDGRADVYAPTNTIIITTTATNLRRLLDIIHQIDVPGFEQQIEIIKLNYADATEMASMIQEIYSENNKSRTSSLTPIPSIRQIRTSTSSRSISRTSPSTIIGSETSMRIVADARTNSLILVATKTMIGQVKELIAKLDSSIAWEKDNLHVYPLLNADATDIADMLNQLISGTQPRRGATQSRAQQQSQIQPFEREVNIVAYDTNNSLLIMADPQDYKVLEGIIKSLDVQQRQVFVEAVILEVTVDDGYEVAVDLSALDQSDVAAASSFGSVAAIATALAAGPAGAPTGGVIGVLSQNRTMTFTVPGGGTMEVPLTPAVLTALQKITDVDVLSAPHLLTTDNVESSIVVGQKVPFISGTSRSLDQSAIQSTLFSSVQREDVGITLTVTPQISEGEYVKLEVKVENSSIGEPPPGQTVDLVGPTVNRAEVDNTIVLRDGHTAIIGGLMSSQVSNGRSKIPLLGDIPILGFFFRATNSRTIKRNMVVMLTPEIIKNDEDLAKVTKQHNEAYSNTKATAMESSNYLKKIFKRVKRK